MVMGGGRGGGGLGWCVCVCVCVGGGDVIILIRAYLSQKNKTLHQTFLFKFTVSKVIFYFI